ncbi:STAS domain-containing protein [Actinomadura scrupuli]|uniref:STAS domain-containing protein n=1 Tax=Actinomadura scrupuli TaxID=559629 RepID=UPI003D992AFF
MVETPSPQADGLSVTLGLRGTWITVEVIGELDFATRSVLDEQLEEVVARRGLPHVALDLSRLSFCDSSGLSALIGARKRVHAAGGELLLLNPRPRLIELLRITGLDRLFTVHDILPEPPTG